jgi:hypothetical protein
MNVATIRPVRGRVQTADVEIAGRTFIDIAPPDVPEFLGKAQLFPPKPKPPKLVTENVWGSR